MAFSVPQASSVEQKIIGTVYYQPKNTDFRDEKNEEVAELGLLAIEPEFWGNNISEKLVGSVFDLARMDKMRAIYIYAIGSRTDDGKYSNKLLEFYSGKGFQYVTPWKSTNDVYTTPDKSIDMVVMLKPMFEELQPLSIYSLKKNETFQVKEYKPSDNGRVSNAASILPSL
jgi:N-acetylglutamate synthase-like GNAT family acetyltransferase